MIERTKNIFKFKIYIYYLCIKTNKHGGPSTTCRIGSTPPTIQDLRTELGIPGLVTTLTC